MSDRTPDQALGFFNGLKDWESKLLFSGLNPKVSSLKNYLQDSSHARFIFSVSLTMKLHGPDTDISEEAAKIQIGVGLMVCQQFGGINRICFYTSDIFEQAGKDYFIILTFEDYFDFLTLVRPEHLKLLLLDEVVEWCSGSASGDSGCKWRRG
ncbi:hypothetical protein ACFE04_021256 [Oxalis oulophora]